MIILLMGLDFCMVAQNAHCSHNTIKNIIVLVKVCKHSSEFSKFFRKNVNILPIQIILNADERCI